MNFHVQLTDVAKDNVRSIMHWIEQRSATGAEAWYRKWSEVLQTLKLRGNEFGIAPESNDYDEPIRQVIFKTKRGRPYRALFMVRQAEVFVLHVRGPGQDLLPSEKPK